MFTIIKRRELNPTVTELCIHAPLIAKKAKAGQFIGRNRSQGTCHIGFLHCSVTYHHHFIQCLRIFFQCYLNVLLAAHNYTLNILT